MQKFYRKAFPFETHSFQSLANLNVKKNENVCVVVHLMDIKYCCYISIKKFAICDIYKTASLIILKHSC